MSFTNFLETEILDHVFAGAAYTAPGTKYLALFTAISDGEAGSVTEVSASYTPTCVTVPKPEPVAVAYSTAPELLVVSPEVENATATRA